MKKLTKEEINKGLKRLIKLKASDVPKEKRWLFKELEKPLKALAKTMLKKV